MKFKDLEIGQDFRWQTGEPLSRKTSNSHFSRPGKGPEAYADKRLRNYSVIPESEPPSSIEAAKRDARWWLLTDMTVKTDEVRALRDREGIGIFEAQRRIKQANLQSGLDVLHLELLSGTEANQVLHDLIEIVRELV